MKHKPLPTKEIVGVVNKLKQINEIQGIYLFGSYARGKPTPMSDIDIAVIAAPISRDQKVAVTLAGSTNNFDISLLDDLPPVIAYRVFKEGKPLYIKDKLAVHRRQVRAMRDYFDYKPALDRLVKRILKNA
jgi:predicted nucleotidyltransferase